MEHPKAFLPRDLEFNISLLFSFLCLFLGSQCAKAQRNELLSNKIATLQVTAGDRWQDLPIISLNQGEVVNISFDDLTHEHRRLCYRIIISSQLIPTNSTLTIDYQYQTTAAN